MKRINQDAERALTTGKPRKILWTGKNSLGFNNEKNFPHYFDADQLYEIDKDIYELTNLADNPAFAEALDHKKDQLREALRTIPGTFGEFTETQDDADKTERDEEASSEPHAVQ